MWILFYLIFLASVLNKTIDLWVTCVKYQIDVGLIISPLAIILAHWTMLKSTFVQVSSEAYATCGYFALKIFRFCFPLREYSNNKILRFYFLVKIILHIFCMFYLSYSLRLMYGTQCKNIFKMRKTDKRHYISKFWSLTSYKF